MARKITFVTNEHYHCFNRGVEKRIIFTEQQDYVYFLKLLRFLNTPDKYGKLRLHELHPPREPLVTILSYCLLPNHFHLLLRQEVEDGISIYLKRVLGGYAMYFNQKYNRSGALFQGPYKAIPLTHDQDLRQVLAYVRFNNLVHKITDKNLFRSSINLKDSLVRDLVSNFGDNKQKEVVEIVRELRDIHESK